METTKPAPRQTAQHDPPTPTQAEADALKLQAHGADATDHPPENVDVPVITGTGTPGSTLSCTMGNWTNEPTSYVYQWRAGATSLGTGESYTVAESDVGSDVVCVVTATNAFGSTAAPPSDAVSIAAAAARSPAPARERGEGDEGRPARGR